MTKNKRPTFRFGFFWPYEDAEKSYGIAIAFSAGTIFLARFLQDGPPVAFTFLVSAALGFFFKWRKMPLIGVLLLAYFMFAPLLFPYGSPSNMIFRQVHFDPMTMIVVLAVIIYLSAQYRLYTIIDRAMPRDSTVHVKGQPDSHLRTVLTIERSEMVRMTVLGVGCMVAAEIAYLLSTELYFEPFQQNFPVRLAGRTNMETENGWPGSVQPWLSRLVLTLGGLVIFVVFTRLIFWYWRLNEMSREVGKAIVYDSAWEANHSNLRRNWLWRAWAVERDRRKSK